MTNNLIQNRYLAFMEEVKKIALDAGRNPSSVRVVAVSKKFSVEDILSLCQLGCTHFAESFAVEFLEKKEKLSHLPIHWHFIGHLQRNKAHKVAGKVDLIHSLDSIPLAQKLNTFADQNNTQLHVLIQVNMSRENTKYGFPPDELVSTFKMLLHFKHLKICGLMTMGSIHMDEKAAQVCFADLRKLQEEINTTYSLELKDLSMGMSGDYRWAIQEGATWIRVGSKIFGPRKKELPA